MKHQRLQWVIINILLFSLGIGLGAAHYPTDFDGLRCPTYEGDSLADCFLFGSFLGAITGVVIGTGQGIILRKVHNWQKKHLMLWIGATMVAFSLGHGIGDSAPIPQELPWSALGLGLVSGLLLGGLQWFVLRNHVSNAIRWVWQSTIGFGVGLGLVGIAALLLLDVNRNSVFGWHTFINLMIFVTLDGLFVGGFWAFMTGRTVKEV